MTPNNVLIAVTIPLIATGLLLWAKLRRIIVILEDMKAAKSKN